MEGSLISTVNFRNFVAANRIPMGQIQELVEKCLSSGEKFAQMEIVIEGQKRLIKATRGISSGEVLLTTDNDYN
jgi:hypothetical protein